MLLTIFNFLFKTITIRKTTKTLKKIYLKRIEIISFSSLSISLQLKHMENVFKMPRFGTLSLQREEPSDAVIENEK